MAVRADNAFAGSRKSLFRDKRVLYAHIPYIEVVFYVIFPCECTALLCKGRRLYILVRCEVIHNESDAVSVEYAVEPVLLKFVYRDGSGYIVSKHQIELCAYQLSRSYTFKTGGTGKYFLSNSHICSFGRLPEKTIPFYTIGCRSHKTVLSYLFKYTLFMISFRKLRSYRVLP